jgi:exopolyphosphatase/guanosine-5'-triphosphate,3'-diphosphate pyrophosphatase
VTAPARRLASIDLGTNTVRLLVVDAGPTAAWRVLEQDQTVTRLGEGLATRGCLAEEPMARTRAVVAGYLARARRAGAEEVRVIATSAVREAANGREFCAALAAIGAAVQIVSGEDEARLTLLGIVRGLGAPVGPLLAFDIGGGSTEFVLAADSRVEASVSLRLGVVELAERFSFPGVVEWPRYQEMAELVRRRLATELPPAIRRAGLRDLVGTAGTVTTLAALDLGLTRYDASRVHGHRLERSAVERLRDRLGALTVAQRAALPCLEPGRADLIVPGLAITLAALDVTGTGAVVVSEWGLREGILAEALDGDR